MSDGHLTLGLTPHGHLVTTIADDAPALEPARAQRVERSFACGSSHGLVHLRGTEVGDGQDVADEVVTSFEGLRKNLRSEHLRVTSETVPGTTRRGAVIPGRHGMYRASSLHQQSPSVT